MRLNPIIRIILFSLAIVVLSGILFAGIGATLFSVQNDWRETLTEMPQTNVDSESRPSQGTSVQANVTDAANQFNASEISEIEINWISGSIRIGSGSTNDQIIVSESTVSDEDYKMVCRREGDKLIIDFCKKKNNFGINIPLSKDLVIELPANWNCDSIDLETASADIFVTDLTVRELDVESASGKCEIVSCEIGEFDLDTASGDIYFEGSVTNLEVDAASANCKFIIANFPKALRFDMASGDVELILPDDQGFTCNVDTLSGSIHNHYAEHHQKGSYTHGDGSCRIQINAVSGDVTIMPQSLHNGHH